MAQLLAPQLRWPLGRLELPEVEQLQRPHDALAVVGVDLRRPPTARGRQAVRAAAGAPARSSSAGPALAHPLRRRRAQIELGQRRAQVEAGAADHDRTAPGGEQIVDLGVGQLGVLAGAEGRVERQERDQPVFQQPPARPARRRRSGSPGRRRPAARRRRPRPGPPRWHAAAAASATATAVLPTPVGPNSAIIAHLVGSQLVQIAGSSVLLTGATGGIGQAIARALAARGAQLILTGRRADVLEPLAAELGARAIAADLSVRGRGRAPARRRPARSTSWWRTPRCRPPGGWRPSRVEEIDRALDVNLRAPIVLAHALLPAMLERRRGQLVFISSLAGKAAAPGDPLYNATKFGLRGFAAALRADLHGSGVGVSGVFPGFIRDAGMFADAGVELPPGVGTRTPEDVAARASSTAIERDRGEIDVAPLPLRAGAVFADLAPDLAAARRAPAGGSDEIAREDGAAPARQTLSDGSEQALPELQKAAACCSGLSSRGRLAPACSVAGACG